MNEDDLENPLPLPLAGAAAEEPERAALGAGEAPRSEQDILLSNAFETPKEAPKLEMPSDLSVPMGSMLLEVPPASKPGSKVLPASDSPSYPFFDVDLKGKHAKFAIKAYDVTTPRENHALPFRDYKGPSLYFEDPKTEVVSEDMKGRTLNPWKTYRYMMKRSIDRQSNGEYAPSSISTRLWSLLFALIMMVFLILLVYRVVTQAQGSIPKKQLVLTFDQMLVYFVVIVVVPWVFLGGKTSEFLKGILFVVDVWFLLIFILTITFASTGEDREVIRDEPAFRDTFITLTVVAASAVVALLIMEILLYRIMPWLLGRGSINDEWTRRLWNIEPVEDRPWTWSYRAFLDLQRRSTFSYRGSVNENAEPHGHGEWLDDGLRGESLIGSFREGIPVAPFNSNIPSTGSAFTATRIGFGRNNKAAWDTGNLTPERDPLGLSVGVAAVEVSVAGKFLKHLPISTIVMEPEHVVSTGSGVSPATAKMVDLLTSAPGDPTIDECVLYVHGLWNTAETAVAEISQFRALAAYSPKIKFFCFDWPAGLYPWARFATVRKMSMTQGVKEDLRDFIKQLTRAGFRKFNIIGHSMGVRVSCHITEFIEELFRPLLESQINRPPGADSLPELSTLTLIHGELDLIDFISTKFPVLRQYCNVITDYTDSNDRALETSEFLTKRLSLGRNPDACFVDPYATNVGISEGQFDFVTESRIEFEKLLRTAPESVTFKRRATTSFQQANIDRQAHVERVAAEATQAVNGVAIEMSELQNGKSVGGTDGAGPAFAKNNKFRGTTVLKQPRIKVWLDLDVIDSSFLDSNAGIARHSIFVFNRSLLDDIHDIITQKKRASERTSRLLRRTGNVYYFLITPSFISL